MKNFQSMGLRLRGGKLEVLDQRKLPHEEVWVETSNPEAMIGCIRSLAVRGAPLIGVAAAMALAQFAEQEQDPSKVRICALALREARPTAVNLMNVIDRMLARLERDGVAALPVAAEEIFAEDVDLCRRMGQRAAAFIESGDGVLTHCNTGGLATAGIGTALGGIASAWASGKRFQVYVDETRPLLQGARLTTWELAKLGIPFTLICDNMAAALMQAGKVQKIFVGADRIAANGDVANKIGTYAVAVLAHFHRIPFYVVAPSTTLDPACPTGALIPIEERIPEEVRGSQGLPEAKVWNPAFDVTPRALISKIVLEDRVF